MSEFIYQVRFDQGRIYRWKLAQADKVVDKWGNEGYMVHEGNRTKMVASQWKGSSRYEPIFHSRDDAISQLLVRLRERAVELANQLACVKAKIDACESMDEGIETMRLIMEGSK